MTLVAPFTGGSFSMASVGNLHLGVNVQVDPWKWTHYTSVPQ